MEKLPIYVTFFAIGLCIFVIGQRTNSTQKYCFNFTWLGPKFTNETNLNSTCDDFTKGSSHVPCKMPLVVTEDGTYPNVSYMWDYHRFDVSCLLVDGEVCAKYAYKFDGFFENITFMCTKVMTVEDEILGLGCLNSKKKSREIEVCTCKTLLPNDIPCNG